MIWTPPNRRRHWLLAAAAVVIAGAGVVIGLAVRPDQPGDEPRWLSNVASRQDALPVCTDVLMTGACRASVGGAGTRALPANAIGDSWRYEFGFRLDQQVTWPAGHLVRLATADGGHLGIYATAVDQGNGVTVQLSDDDFEAGATTVGLDDGSWHWVSLTCTSAGAWNLKVDGKSALSGANLPYGLPRFEERSPTGDAVLAHVAFTVDGVPTADSYETSVAELG